MTTKEMEFKLAKDIARIRIVAGLAGHETTLAAEIVRAMKELDGAQEMEIVKDIAYAMGDAEKKEAIGIIMTPRYVQEVMSKLQIRANARRAGAKTLKAFTEADYKKATKMQSEELKKAADLIVSNITRAPDKSAVINAIVAELYAYDEEKTRSALLKTVGDGIPEELRKNMKLIYIPFTSVTQEAVEHLEKVQYHGKWIYERFQPAGIIRVDAMPEIDPAA